MYATKVQLIYNHFSNNNFNNIIINTHPYYHKLVNIKMLSLVHMCTYKQSAEVQSFMLYCGEKIKS